MHFLLTAVQDCSMYFNVWILSFNYFKMFKYFWGFHMNAAFYDIADPPTHTLSNLWPIILYFHYLYTLVL